MSRPLRSAHTRMKTQRSIAAALVEKCSCVFGHPGRSDGAVPVCQRHLSRSGSPGLKAKPNQNSLAWYQDVRMNFDAPAVLRKWPSLKDERVSSGCPPFLTVLLMSASGSSCPSPHPSVIYMRSTPLRRGELISAVLTTDQIVELVRLRDFLSAGTGGVFSFEQCGGRATCCRVSSGDSEAAEAIRGLVETATGFRTPSRPGLQLRLWGARTHCLGSRPPPTTFEEYEERW